MTIYDWVLTAILVIVSIPIGCSILVTFIKTKRDIPSALLFLMGFGLFGVSAVACSEDAPDWLRVWIAANPIQGLVLMALCPVTVCVMAVIVRQLLVKNNPNTVTEVFWTLFAYVLMLLMCFIPALIISAAAITYNLGHVWSWYNPFERSFSLNDARIFYIDHALKGMLFDVMEVFELTVGDELKFNPRRHFWFAVFVWSFRTLASFITMAAMLQIVIGYWTRKQTERF